MHITKSMVLFWVAIILVPLVVSVTAIGIVPNDQTVVKQWDLPGLVHGGSPTQIMMVALVLSAGNIFFAAGYLFNNGLVLADVVKGKPCRSLRIVCVAGAITLAAAATIIAAEWSQMLISTLFF